MFVGKSSIDLEYIKRNYNNPEKIIEYSNSLIPKEFSHLKELNDNQLYYICMILRKSGLRDFKGVNSTINTLLKGVKIVGYVDEVIEISVIYDFVNMKKLNIYLERL